MSSPSACDFIILTPSETRAAKACHAFVLGGTWKVPRSGANRKRAMSEKVLRLLHKVLFAS